MKFARCYENKYDSCQTLTMLKILMLFPCVQATYELPVEPEVEVVEEVKEGKKDVKKFESDNSVNYIDI